MFWHAAATSFGRLLAEIQTGDPTSLELALVGIVVFLGYEIVARPAHARRNMAARGPVVAKPPFGPELGAEGRAAEKAATERRRVA